MPVPTPRLSPAKPPVSLGPPTWCGTGPGGVLPSLQPGNPGPQDGAGLRQGTGHRGTWPPRTLSQDGNCGNQHVDNDRPSSHITTWVWSPHGHQVPHHNHSTVSAPIPCPCVPPLLSLLPCPLVNALIPVFLCPHPCGPVAPHPPVPLSLCPCVLVPVSLSLCPCVPHVPVSLSLCAHRVPVSLVLSAHPCAPVPVSVSPSPVPVPVSPSPVPVPVSLCPPVRSLCAYLLVPVPVFPCRHPVSVSPSSHVPVSLCPCSCVLVPAPRAACPVLSRALPLRGLQGLCRVEARTSPEGSQLLPRAGGTASPPAAPTVLSAQEP